MLHAWNRALRGCWSLWPNEGKLLILYINFFLLSIPSVINRPPFPHALVRMWEIRCWLGTWRPVWLLTMKRWRNIKRPFVSLMARSTTKKPRWPSWKGTPVGWRSWPRAIPTWGPNWLLSMNKWTRPKLTSWRSSKIPYLTLTSWGASMVNASRIFASKPSSFSLVWTFLKFKLTLRSQWLLKKVMWS